MWPQGIQERAIHCEEIALAPLMPSRQPDHPRRILQLLYSQTNANSSLGKMVDLVDMITTIHTDATFMKHARSKTTDSRWQERNKPKAVEFILYSN